MNRYLVTGGAGFIGSMVVRLLLERTDRVVVVDDFSSGKEENLREVASGVDLRAADIRHFDRIEGHFRGITHVFHLAAIPSVPRSITEPVPSHESNIDGTFNVLRACDQARTRRVVYAASSSAYGDTEVLPKTESMTPDPLSPYALQKLVGEYYMRLFTTCFGVETVSLRFFNVYGPRQDPTSQYSGVLSVFMSSLLDRRAPTIFGDGEQSRDFTYVEDVAGLCLKAAEAQGVAGRMYNAGNGGRYTLNEIWRELCRMEGVSIQPKYGPPRAGDVRHSQADTAAAKRDLGHSPRFTIEQGLKQTLDWYRQSLKPA
ncbi:MAG: SDR family oxidoreductase [Bryobacterales bacterium]|nr:SDR family oxidoreductase [Bryobacterales bacterium]